MLVRSLLFLGFFLSTILMSLIVSLVLPMSVMQTRILVQEVCLVQLLISHDSDLFLCYISPVIMTGPVAWTSLLSILASVIHRPCHVDVEREI